jgi:hypothetical protein
MIDYEQFAISDFWPLSSDLRLHHLEFNYPMAYIYLLASNDGAQYRFLQKCQRDNGFSMEFRTAAKVDC